MKEPRFSELQKVQVNDGVNPPYEGYVIALDFDKGRWTYEISISDDPPSKGSWENWAAEEWLTRMK